ncbi:hypothetical protein GQX73_g5045 [Xylaria multiplex]|uniref:Aminoglycoside phosphotransferase domain-containing protein n=1 Tax=Xylaria multiplex TaxID=323545 RepID=A0A7C8N7L9_9PEZI|nr:hypothetical protein GQX73_g5045 [Xylaria multiplex]
MLDIDGKAGQCQCVFLSLGWEELEQCARSPYPSLLGVALTYYITGYEDTYHMRSASDNPPDCLLWQRALSAKYDGIGEFGRQEWDQLLGHCQAVTDWPAIAFSEELIAMYPEAKVILPGRDIDSWHASVLKTVYWRVTDIEFRIASYLDPVAGTFYPMLKKFFETFFEGDFPNKGKAIYHEHYRKIRNLVPPERLLEFKFIMAPPTQEEKDALINKVLQALSETPYACSSLTHLSNGTTNFVFRGKLIQTTHKDGAGGNTAPITTVIVKHSLEHAALNKNLPIDTSRALYEGSMLDALNDFSSGVAGIKAPRLYLFIRDTNIQVLEDFPDAIDLKSILVSLTWNPILMKSVAASVGYGIGAWLRSFHNWSMSRNGRLKNIGNNEPMRKLKYAITYDSHLRILENNFPALLEGHRLALEQVKDAAMKEFEKVSKDGDEDRNWGFIHGDFCVLLPDNSAPPETQHPGGVEAFIIDWEFTQFGHRAYDIGQIIGDIYERWHFSGAEGAIPAIEGFIDGYGGLEDDALAFRVVIHAGVQLIGCLTYTTPTVPFIAPPAMRKITTLVNDLENATPKHERLVPTKPMSSTFLLPPHFASATYPHGIAVQDWLAVKLAKATPVCQDKTCSVVEGLKDFNW